MDSLLPASRFRVTVGDEVIGLCRVSGVALAADEARPVVRVERALSRSRALFDWRDAVDGDHQAVRDVLIEQLDSHGARAVLGFRLHGARPVAWYAPTWDSDSEEVAIEALEIVYERLQWVDITEAP